MKFVEVERESAESAQLRHEAALKVVRRRRRAALDKLDLVTLERALKKEADLVVFGTKPRETITILGRFCFER